MKRSKNKNRNGNKNIKQYAYMIKDDVLAGLDKKRIANKYGISLGNIHKAIAFLNNNDQQVIDFNNAQRSISLKEAKRKDKEIKSKIKEEPVDYSSYQYDTKINVNRQKSYIIPDKIAKLIVEDYKTKMKNNNFGRNSNGSVKTFREEVNERFGQEMKFDIVIGNPPYNNDIYIDFVMGGYTLIKEDGYVVMITPAKWQAKGGKKNEDFRKNIVPFRCR